MPIPKLLTVQGRKMPDWNLTQAQFDKAQAAFRADIPAEAAPAKAKKKGVKKAAKKRATKGRARAESAAATTRLAASPLVAIKAKDLVFNRRRWEEIFRLILTRKRKNQKNLTATEWDAFIHAIQAIASPGAASPTFQEIVNIHIQAMDPNNHAAHAWGVHTMMGHNGRNFLAWHREFLAKLEARLMLVNPLVTIPYWNWIEDRAVPPQLSNPSDISAWGITRGTFNVGMLPTQSDINTVTSNTNFAAFQSALEAPHGWVHNAVGGTMATSASPADPLFWLHHAFVDKIWADWQKTHTGKPTNLTETMQPPPIITRKVSEVLDISALGYAYV